MNFTFHSFFIFLYLFGEVISQNAPKAHLSTMFKPKKGEKASLGCVVSSGDPPFDFNWLKDGKLVENSASLRFGNLGDSSILTIDSMSSIYNGNYTCNVKNLAGSDSQSFELVVEGPPTWIKKQENVESHHGSDIVLRCSASGYPKHKVSWQKFENSVWEKINFENNIDKSSEEEIIIRGINKKNAGKYGCEISNGQEPNLWNEFEVKIIVPAEFKEKNTAVSAKKGNILELECSAEGDSPITIKWSKDSTSFDKLDQSRYHVTDQPTKTGLKSILNVNSADIKDNGLYVCLTENSFGKDERNIRVTIIEPPSAPDNFAVQRAWSRIASLSWNKPAKVQTSLLGYIIRYWKVSSSGGNDRLNEVNVSASMNSYFIRNLEPGSRYEASILALNEVGFSETSQIISFETGEEEPSAAPSDLQAVARGPTTIRIAWKPPPQETWNGKLLGYYIGYRVAGDFKTPYSFKTLTSGEFNATYEYLLSLLIKATKYAIVVKPYNKAGSGPASQEVVVETLSGDVPISPQLYVASVTTDSITLKYSLPPSSINKIQNLDIHFKEGEDVWREMDFFYDSKAAGEYTLTSLNPDTIYMVYLTASNENGVSDPSPVIRTKTVRSAGESFVIGSVFDPASGAFGDYWDIVSILSIVVASAVIIIVVVLAFVYVRKAQIEAATKPNFEFCVASQVGTLAYNKSIPNFGTERRYTDPDNNMPLMSGNIDNGNLYPVSYSNLPTENRHSKLIDPKHIYDFPR